MRRVVLLRDYRCAPSGAVVESFPAGQEVSGKVADWALADGAAREVKVVEPQETKRKSKTRTRKAANR